MYLKISLRTQRLDTNGTSVNVNLNFETNKLSKLVLNASNIIKAEVKNTLFLRKANYNNSERQMLTPSLPIRKK